MIKLSNPTEYNGYVQLYESECGFNYGEISGNPKKMAAFLASFNLAVKKYFSIAIQASGTWELDDSNHSKYSTIYANLVSGQRDYQFLLDEQGNTILDVYKVLIKPFEDADYYVELNPVDETSSENSAIINEKNTGGVPTMYGKRANAIFLGGAVPDYNAVKGVKVLINRSPYEFTVNDTDKTVGFPYHEEYFYLKPSYEYLRKKANKVQIKALSDEIIKLEGDPENGRIGLIARTYGARKKDEVDVISGECINSI